MSAASVLTSFGPSTMPGPVMTDVAMRFYISHSPPPLRSFISSYGDLQRAKTRAHQSAGRSTATPLYQPLRPCLSSRRRAADDHPAWAKKKPVKKSVVFADTKGLSLTAVHVFSKFDDEPFQSQPAGGVAEELQFDMTDLEAATVDLRIGPARSLALDFQQPSADYLDFRNRLIHNCVSLENCSLQERSLTGTVKVRNVGYEKSVQVRVTYDSWASFTDVDCSFLNNVYGCQDTDTFAFELELPAHTPPHHRIEFCVCFRAQGRTYWDNNDGKNYPLKHVGWGGEEAHRPPAPRQEPSEHKAGAGRLQEPEFDQFGSPRMSSGLFPGWQSWGQVENSVPYW